MITPEQLETLYELIDDIEEECIVIFVVHESQIEQNLIGIDVLEYWQEDIIDGGWFSYEDAIDLIKSHHLDENE